MPAVTLKSEYQRAERFLVRAVAAEKKISEALALHTEYPGDHTCYICGDDFPCLTVQVLTKVESN